MDSNKSISGHKAFEECLNCAYPLVGHSGEFICPECGTHYDEETSIYYSSFSLGGPKYRRREWVLGCTILVAMGIFVFTYFYYGPVVMNYVVGFGMVVFLVTISLALIRRNKASRTFMAITPIGVLVNYSGRRQSCVSFPWVDVERIVSKIDSKWNAAQEVALEFGLALPHKEAVDFYQKLTTRLTVRARTGGPGGPGSAVSNLGP